MSEKMREVMTRKPNDFRDKKSKKHHRLAFLISDILCLLALIRLIVIVRGTPGTINMFTCFYAFCREYT